VGFSIVGLLLAWRRAAPDVLIPQILSEPNEELSDLMREIITSLYAFMLQIDERIRVFDKRIDAIFKAAKSARVSPRVPALGLDRDGHDLRRAPMEERKAAGVRLSKVVELFQRQSLGQSSLFRSAAR
jgi:hypothetical protein